MTNKIVVFETSRAFCSLLHYKKVLNLRKFGTLEPNVRHKPFYVNAII